MWAERARGWLVVPFWTSQPWMGTLLRMLVQGPRLIMRLKGVLSQPLSEEDHPIMQHTKLMTCLLSGNTCEAKAYQRKVQTSSWLHGDQKLRSNIGLTLTDEHNFVRDGTLIPLLLL